MPLPFEHFADLVRNAPLVAVDFLVFDTGGSVLMGKRNNAPARGTWCVPGGRIRKGETIAQAVARKLREELGLADLPELTWHGIYEHFYPDSSFDESVSTHYVALVFSFVLHDATALQACSQHDELRFFSKKEFMTSPDVPDEMKVYLTGGFWEHLHLDP
jgi:colanic acid biosynthesis protein WcaH